MPQIQVWINNDTPSNVEKLVKTLNDAVVDNKEKRLKGFFIFVDPSGKKIEPKLEAIASKTKSNDVCLAYLPPKDGAVTAYKINLDPAVKNTVMLYRDRTVVVKKVNLVADEKGLAELKTAIGTLLK